MSAGSVKASNVVERVCSTNFLHVGGLLVSEDSTQQSVLFEGWFGKPLIARFDQPLGTSDAGLVLLRGVDDALGVTASMASALTDEQDPMRSALRSGRTAAARVEHGVRVRGRQRRHARAG